MKTIILSLIFIASSVLAMAQISLEKSYDYSATSCEFSNGDQYYYLMDVALEQCRIYTTDHSLYKTINLTVPNNYYISDIQLVSTNVFNTDNTIELLYIYEKYVATTTGYYMEYGLRVINEDGSNLLTLDNGGYAALKQVNGENKLFAYTYIYNTSGYYEVSTNIYSLGGTTSTVSVTKMDVSVYPNPANNKLIISTHDNPEIVGSEFNLYTVTGKKVMSQTITDKQEQVIPINNVPSGAYFYSINNENNFKYSNTLIVR